MIEIVGNMWKIDCDAICVTTNGIIKKDGTAVMGAGVAHQAKIRYPSLPRELATALRLTGNHVYHIPQSDCTNIITFPTKHNWKDDSDIALIEQSCKELVVLTDKSRWNKIVLTRPGCANGKLDWSIVKPILEKHLDDRFIIISPR
jgi:hypothetical protein